MDWTVGKFFYVYFGLRADSHLAGQIPILADRPGSMLFDLSWMN